MVQVPMGQICTKHKCCNTKWIIVKEKNYIVLLKMINLGYKHINIR